MTISRTLAAWAVLCTSCVSSPSALAEQWKELGSEGYLGTRSLDLDSVRVDGNLIRYRIRLDKFGTVREVITRCREWQRFEIVYPSDRVDLPFRTVYPGTPIGMEVVAACEVAGQTPPQQEVRPRIQPATPIARPDISPSKTEIRIFTGSGFLIDPERVVTNYHVVQPCANIQVRQDSDSQRAILRYYSEKHDLAVLSTAGPMAGWAPLRRTGLLGEEVVVAGHPLAGVLSSDLIVTSGQINALAGIGNDPGLLQISAPVQPGNSGGPLIDKSGAVVGVVVSKVNVERMAKITGDMAQNINFAIKPEILRLFLDSNRLRYREATSTKKLEGHEIAEQARLFTVQITCETQ